jgi:hypothetical protein
LRNRQASDREHRRTSANDPANELRPTRWMPIHGADTLAVVPCSGALRSTRHPVSGVGESPTDQKVGGSTPSERAELVQVTAGLRVVTRRSPGLLAHGC